MTRGRQPKGATGTAPTSTMHDPSALPDVAAAAHYWVQKLLEQDRYRDGRDLWALSEAATRVAPPNMSLAAKQRLLPEPNSPQRIDVLDSYHALDHDFQAVGLGAVFGLTHPKVADVFEWRVELSCGCIHQKYTNRNDAAAVKSLLTRSDCYLAADPPGDLGLPAGQHVCCHETCSRPRRRPVRDIVEWIQRSDTTTNIEAIEGGRIEYARWDVALDCGHLGSQSTALDWHPRDGHVSKGRGESSGRSPQQWEGLFEEMRDYPDLVERMRRDRAEFWPEPAPFRNCDACEYTRYIVAYQLVGPVVPPPKSDPTPRQRKTPEEVLQERIRRTQRELRRARSQLKKLQQECADPAKQSTKGC